MPILTLTTDWGLRDHYLAAFKGALISSLPSLQIIDVSHEVEKYNTMQGGFIVRNSFLKFPPGSIHYIGVSGNENCQSEQPYVLIKTNDRYLIGEDTGIFTLVLDKNDKEIRRLPWEKEMVRGKVFQFLQETLIKLAGGAPFESFGTAETVLQESYFASPTSDQHSIRGSIIYIDSYGNSIVNITREMFENQLKGRKFTIHFRKSEYNVSSISPNYETVESGEMLAMFNMDGFLEIAINKDSAVKLLGLRLMDLIRIEFHDNPNS